MARISYTGMFSLSEQLSQLTVPELKELAFGLRIKFKSGAKKNIIVKILNELILQSPEKLIRMSFSYELQAYLDAIEGRLSYKYARDSYLLSELNRFRLLYATKTLEENSVPVVRFVEDLADRFKELIPEELKRREDDGRLLCEKLALGCANIYGYTEFYYIQKYIPIVEERLGIKIDGYFFNEAYRPIAVVTHDGVKGEKIRPFLSPFASLVDFYPDESNIDFDVKPKEFDLDTILKYGEMPYPKFPFKEAKSLEKVIEKWGKKEFSPEYVVRSVWFDKQDKSDAQMITSIMDYVYFKDVNQLNECISAATEFCNNVPYWQKCGNSSHEIFIQKEKENLSNGNRMPNIVIGPNMRAMGIESFEQLMGSAHNPFTNFNQRVGRNDPCPCGSGKKYKNCCGK